MCRMCLMCADNIVLVTRKYGSKRLQRRVARLSTTKSSSNFGQIGKLQKKNVQPQISLLNPKSKFFLWKRPTKNMPKILDQRAPDRNFWRINKLSGVSEISVGCPLIDDFGPNFGGPFSNQNLGFTEVLKSIRTPPPFLGGVPFFISPGDLACAQNSWGNEKRHAPPKNVGGFKLT